MEIKLNESEIREALAAEMAKKILHSVPGIDPEACWFEGEIKQGGVLRDIKFCFKTKPIGPENESFLER